MTLGTLLFSTITMLLAQGNQAVSDSSQFTPGVFFGLWMRTYPDTVFLLFNEYTSDSCIIKLTSFNGHYPGEIGGGVKEEDVRYARIVKNDAYFNDRGAYSDKRPLYYDDEEPCELLFRMSEKDRMEVYEENCHLIYGGAGVTWGGEYFKYY